MVVKCLVDTEAAIAVLRAQEVPHTFLGEQSIMRMWLTGNAVLLTETKPLTMLVRKSAPVVALVLASETCPINWLKANLLSALKAKILFRIVEVTVEEHFLYQPNKWLCHFHASGTMLQSYSYPFHWLNVWVIQQ